MAIFELLECIVNEVERAPADRRRRLSGPTHTCPRVGPITTTVAEIWGAVSVLCLVQIVVAISKKNRITHLVNISSMEAEARLCFLKRFVIDL